MGIKQSADFLGFKGFKRRNRLSNILEMSGKRFISEPAFRLNLAFSAKWRPLMSVDSDSPILENVTQSSDRFLRHQAQFFRNFVKKKYSHNRQLISYLANTRIKNFPYLTRFFQWQSAYERVIISIF